MSSKKPKQTLNGIFDEFLKDIKKSKHVINDFEELKETLTEFISNEKRPISEICRALDELDNQSGDLEIRERLRDLNSKIKDANWKDWMDLVN